MSTDYQIVARREEPIEGCAHCSIVEREHGHRYKIEPGWHTFVAPDPELLHRRMWFRRTVRRLDRALRGRA